MFSSEGLKDRDLFDVPVERRNHRTRSRLQAGITETHQEEKSLLLYGNQGGTLLSITVWCVRVRLSS